MSSILTNNSAMVALNTLKSINNDLQKTQSEISTGKSVASAKDNSAVWAISKVMESDVKGFEAISDSLALGESTVAVARNGSETVADLLTEIKGKITAAQEENVSREKIQTDINALTDQIKSVVGAAQFNGLNLLSGTEDINVLSSLDRIGDGDVRASDITVARQDLSTDAGKIGSGASLNANGEIGGSTAATTVVSAANTAELTFTNGADGVSETITVAGVELSYTGTTGALDATDFAASFAGQINALGLEGVTASNTAGVLEISSTRAFEGLEVTAPVTAGGGTVNITAVNGAAPSGDNTATASTIDQRAEQIDFSTAAAVEEGDGYVVTIGASSVQYIAGKGETFEDVARGLKTAIDSAGFKGITSEVVIDDETGQASLKVDNDGTLGASLAFDVNGNKGGEASGGLFGLDKIDVTSTAGANAALDNIETLINNAIDASASFGSAEGRIETQANFISQLTDSLKSGIGALVDADMEEASARLQALQVQQQLGVQALSIANQAPQSILSLFR
ncbi:flagellin N-terminal helical domain-containing protein [Litoreibacter roseus]|uniref:Flagellin n=1 Tax=Litoreibacter roseus TaxID=2601869 RepID=A0A6N6JF48_9RHOB|nr:flagellin [Litoreibacter roseus]GFE64420.1 flagellin [Litoreibacter roseus]